MMMTTTTARMKMGEMTTMKSNLTTMKSNLTTMSLMTTSSTRSAIVLLQVVCICELHDD